MKETAKLLAETFLTPVESIFRARILPFFLAVYMFIAGLPYGKEPVKVDLTYEITSAQEVYSEGDTVTVALKAENVGRPFYGRSFDSMSASFFLVKDGEEKYLSYTPAMISNCALPTKVIIKNGDIQEQTVGFPLEANAPGMYSLRIRYTTYDGTTITKDFENVIEFK